MCPAVVGSADEMKLLIDACADVNAENTFGATALLWSAGDIRKVRMLVDKGADVNAATKQGRTPLMVASSQAGNEEAVRLLPAKGAGHKVKDGFQTTALHCATQSNDTSLIRLLVEKGLDVNAKNQPAFTPLMAAAAQGNLATVKLPLEKGADVNAVSSEKDQPGKLTPLMLSVAYGPAEPVKTSHGVPSRPILIVCFVRN